MEDPLDYQHSDHGCTMCISCASRAIARHHPVILTTRSTSEWLPYVATPLSTVHRTSAPAPPCTLYIPPLPNEALIYTEG
ncbi:hypothetical protein ARMGADRAFT_616796 [Armillaria gallica]|uniref:Uncharacterized protein n=1 Tax=Armillaria gallica TaxID=47427 RepID=A0A2H3CLR8_ARMGA|nr:hypothetical protein ARMGADRAFT_616796 [Armillaria gallica]